MEEIRVMRHSHVCLMLWIVVEYIYLRKSRVIRWVLEGRILCYDRVPPEHERCTLCQDHISNDLS